MSKIDIAIKVTSGGAQEPVVSATGPWVSCVRDVRDIFTQLEHFEGKFITMLSFCPTGSLLTIVHHIPGRTTDNVAAWLHIPTGCAVTGEELSVLITDVKRYLSTASRIDRRS